MSRADSRSAAAPCAASRSGRTVHTQAAVAATIGDAKLVPLTVFHCAGSAGRGTGIDSPGVGGGAAIDSPGAARSTALLPLENAAGWSVLPVAAAVSTCG